MKFAETEGMKISSGDGTEMLGSTLENPAIMMGINRWFMMVNEWLLMVDIWLMMVGIWLMMVDIWLMMVDI